MCHSLSLVYKNDTEFLTLPNGNYSTCLDQGFLDDDGLDGLENRQALAPSCVEGGANVGIEVGSPVGAESTGDLAEGG